MVEETIVRENLMTKPGYKPYCGNTKDYVMPRAVFNGEQFVCPICKWTSQFPIDFIERYKAKWNK